MIGKTQSIRNDKKVTSVHYSWFTQLTEFSLNVDSSNISYVMTSNDNKPIQAFKGKVSSGFWADIVMFISYIDLEKLNQLPAPTDHRAADGAPYAKLRIRTSEEIYETQYFDGGFPMKEILNVLHTINQRLDTHILDCSHSK